MNFLQNMQIPQLGDPNFQSQFEGFCDAIKENFERLISVQYTRGADGNSIEAKQMYIDNRLTGTDNLSPLGYAIVSALFPADPGQSIPTTVNGFNDYLENATTGVAPMFGPHHCMPGYVIDSQTHITEGIQVTLMVDDRTGRAFLAAPYIFIDGRISDLDEYASSITDPTNTFHDYSAMVYGAGIYEGVAGQDKNKPWTWTWAATRLDVIPKLYYDGVLGEFCWLINGQMTHVTAQGIKGDKGRTPAIVLAQGSVDNSNQYKINLTSIERINESGTAVEWISPIYGTNIFDGDLAMVFYNKDNGSSHAFLGPIYFNGTGSYVLMDTNDQDNIFDAIKSQKFREELMAIDRWTTADPEYYDPATTVRGLFLPALIGASFGNPGNVHMTYAEHRRDSNGGNISRLHSAVVTQGASYMMQGASTPEPATGYIGDWTIDYNTGVQGNLEAFKNLSVQGNTVVQGNTTVQGDMRVQGNLYAQGFTATGQPGDTISGRLGVVTTFKDIRYSFAKQADYEEQPASGSSPLYYTMDNIDYAVAMTATLNIKVGIVSDCENNPSGNSYGVQNNSSMVNLMMEQYELQVTQGWPTSANTTSVTTRYNTDQGSGTLFDPAISLPHSPKMYDVVEYNIPIKLNKQLNIPGASTYWDSTRSYQEPNADSYSVKYISVGSTTLGGDYACPMRVNMALTPKRSNHSVGWIDLDRMDKTYENIWDALNQSNNKNLYSPLKQLGVLLATNAYPITGTIHYEPFDIDIEYKMNIFTNIFDAYPSSTSIRTYLTVAPYGYLKATQFLSQKSYYAPIYGNISVNGYHPRPVENETISIIDDILADNAIDSDPNMISKNSQYQRFNGIICDKFEQTLNDSLTKGTLRIDKSYGSDISFLSLFEYYDGAGDTNYGRISSPKSFESKYIKLTTDLALYDNNTKICASNADTGTFVIDTQDRFLKHWVSNDKVYICSLQRRGKYENDYVPDIIQSAFHTNTFWSFGVYDAEHDISVDGLLLYPYSPALVRLPNESAVKISDKYSENDYYEGGRILGNTNQPTTSALTEDSWDIF